MPCRRIQETAPNSTDKMGNVANCNILADAPDKLLQVSRVYWALQNLEDAMGIKAATKCNDLLN